MLPLLSGLAPLITGGASLLGSIFSSDTNAANTQANIAAQSMAQAESERFNANQADINRQFQAGQVQQQEGFQTQMSNTAYQRATADMKAAGLNPMMMFGSGGPASVPSGAAASGSTASVGTPNMALSNKTSPLAGLGDAVKSAMSTAVQQKEMDLLTSKTAEVDLQNRFTRRTLGIPEVDMSGSSPTGKMVGMPELNIQSAQEDINLKRQEQLLQSFNKDQQEAWNRLSPESKDLIIKGKATLNTVGDVVGIGVKAGIGAALSKWSAKGDAPVAINQMDAVAAARKAITDAGGRPKASEVLNLANQIRGKVDSGRSNLIQY